MRNFVCLGLFLFFSKAFAFDCSVVPPFAAIGQQNIKVTVSKFKWVQGQPSYEDVCSKSATMDWYDVRGREEEAYYCLKPAPSEVFSCATDLGSDVAEVKVVPASWIRTWKPDPSREYRFHAYILKKNDSGFYYDIFSRSLLSDLSSQNVILEGSLKTGPSNPDDGFWIRLEFLK